MNELADGRMVPAGTGPVETPGVPGVTETVQVHAGAPVFFEEHVQRYLAGCAWFGVRPVPGSAELRAAAERLIEAGGRPDGVLRWVAWREEAGDVHWRMRFEPPRPHTLKAVWRAAMGDRRLPAPGPGTAWKHLGRHQWREALAAARARGFDEVLLLDAAGRVVEGAISNLFCVDAAGVIRTPGLGCGPLPGVTRVKVLALARELGFPVEEGNLAREDVDAARELFVTNALVDIHPLAALEDRPLVAPGPVTARLQAEWRRRFRPA